ncbi:MAG TPA: ParB/RepB/Spo0J family partition protein [Candidatus Limnocylindrales bacterium]|nr:ParB/RepB/Spo0J family partition protein [Candidatus Limnocylindrales bacterium]
MRQPLGRGLDAIFAGNEQGQPRDGGVNSGKPLLVPIERVVAGRGQPRRRFDDAQLDDLAASIRENGILQPLVVVARGGSYELIAGERRLRAAARAGLEKVPVVLREASSDSEHLELALVENIQREDLGALERARAYERLLETHGHTQDDIARRIGKSRSAIANTLRLLALPQPVLEGLEQGLITEGHARPLLALPTAARQIEAMQAIVRRGLSVRDAEQLVKDWTQVDGQISTQGAAAKKKRPSSLMEQSLSRSLGTKVRLRGSDNKGRIELEFYSREELTRLIDLLTSVAVR